MKTLLLGSTGYIGTAFANKLDNHEVMTHKNVNVQNLLNKFVSTQFDTIINCAGFVGRPNVDAVESNKEEAVYGNIVLPSVLVEFANIIKSVKILHISTGCCFNSSDPLTEEAEPNLDWNSEDACNFYAGTKSMSEKVIGRFPQHYICRLRMPFDEENNDRNLISKLIKYDKVLSLNNSLTHRKDFVDACLSLLSTDAKFGTYNIVNSGHTNNEEICKLITQHLPNIGKSFDDYKFFTNIVDFLNDVGCGPRSNCILSNQKLLDTGFKMRSVQDAIIDSLKNWR